MVAHLISKAVALALLAVIGAVGFGLLEQSTHAKQAKMTPAQLVAQQQQRQQHVLPFSTRVVAVLLVTVPAIVFVEAVSWCLRLPFRRRPVAYNAPPAFPVQPWPGTPAGS